MIELHDKRDPQDFKKITFSKFKKVDVIKELNNNLLNNNLKQSLYWTCELICAGHYIDLWTIILKFYGKYIHVSNPKLIIFLNIKIKLFKNIVDQPKYNIIPLDLRNNNDIRMIFSEIICIMVISKRKHPIIRVKVKNIDYDLSSMSTIMKSPNFSYIDKIFTSYDPAELHSPLNEFAYALSKDQRDLSTSCYWLEWIFGLLKKCKKNNITYKCDLRTFPQVDDKYKTHIIWLFWDIILTESKTRSQIINKIITETMSVFSLRYSPSITPKYILLIYFAISILCDDICLTNKIITSDQQTYMNNVCLKIDKVYEQIKKNEETDNSVENRANASRKTNIVKNIESSMNKMSILDNFNDSFTCNL
jgi:hypothetical protein